MPATYLPMSQSHTFWMEQTVLHVGAQVADVVAKVTDAKSALAQCGHDRATTAGGAAEHLQQLVEQPLEGATARAAARELTSATMLVTQQGALDPSSLPSLMCLYDAAALAQCLKWYFGLQQSAFAVFIAATLLCAVSIARCAYNCALCPTL